MGRRSRSSSSDNRRRSRSRSSSRGRHGRDASPSRSRSREHPRRSGGGREHESRRYENRRSRSPRHHRNDNDRGSDDRVRDREGERERFRGGPDRSYQRNSFQNNRQPPTCYTCGEVGHISRVCNMPRQERGRGGGNNFQANASEQMLMARAAQRKLLTVRSIWVASPESSPVHSDVEVDNDMEVDEQDTKAKLETRSIESGGGDVNATAVTDSQLKKKERSSSSRRRSRTDSSSSSGSSSSGSSSSSDSDSSSDDDDDRHKKKKKSSSSSRRKRPSKKRSKSSSGKTSSRRSSSSKRKGKKAASSSKRKGKKKSKKYVSSSSESSGSSSGSESESESEGVENSSNKVPAPKKVVTFAPDLSGLTEEEKLEAEEFASSMKFKSNAVDEDNIGPALPPKIAGDLATKKVDYGGALRPGEGSAIAAFVQNNLRIPRRGEVGWSGEEIAGLEDNGFVMSGSRHRRMNAIRLRKENQVYTAEEKRALALYNYEEAQSRETEMMGQFKTMVTSKFKSIEDDDDEEES